VRQSEPHHLHGLDQVAFQRAAPVVISTPPAIFTKTDDAWPSGSSLSVAQVNMENYPAYAPYRLTHHSPAFLG
jgi:hypothetical protein